MRHVCKKFAFHPACFKHPARFSFKVHVLPAQLLLEENPILLGPLSLGDVGANAKKADQVAFGVANAGDRDGYAKMAPILPHVRPVPNLVATLPHVFNENIKAAHSSSQSSGEFAASFGQF